MSRENSSLLSKLCFERLPWFKKNFIQSRWNFWQQFQCKIVSWAALLFWWHRLQWKSWICWWGNRRWNNQDISDEHCDTTFWMIQYSWIHPTKQDHPWNNRMVNTLSGNKQIISCKSCKSCPTIFFRMLLWPQATRKFDLCLSVQIRVQQKLKSNPFRFYSSLNQ